VTLTCLGCGSPATGDAPRPEYDQTGRLRQLVFDANQDGRNDAVATLDGARLQRIDAPPSLNMSEQQLRDAFVAAAAQIDARAVIAVQPPGGPSR
jgi:hypothetical protein